MSYPFQVGTLRFGPIANNLNVLEALSSTKIVCLNQLMKVLLCYCNTLIMFIFGWVTMRFCSEYIETTTPVRLPQSHHDCTQGGRGTWGYNVVRMDRQDVLQAHLHILNNIVDIIPFIDTHKQNLIVTHPKMNMMRVLQKHNRTFIN